MKTFFTYCFSQIPGGYVAKCVCKNGLVKDTHDFEGITNEYFEVLFFLSNMEIRSFLDIRVFLFFLFVVVVLVPSAELMHYTLRWFTDNKKHIRRG